MEFGLQEALLRLLLAAGVGIAIGLEREYREKAAGLRTLALVTTGTALFMLSALSLMGTDAVRMAAGVATGIGFLGAGAILRHRGEVLGLTTAATVWIGAALGVTAAAGEYVLTMVGALFTLLILTLLALVDFRSIQMDARVYEITYARQPAWDENVAALPLREAGLKANVVTIAWDAESATVVWRTVGRRASHDRATRSLHENPGVASVMVHV